MRYTVALAQMNSQNNKMENLEAAAAMIKEAASNHARVICFPEMMNLMGRNIGPGGGAEPLSGLTIDTLSKEAKKYGIYVVAGSISESHEGEEDKRFSNTSVLLSPKGELLAAYRKLHMFDIQIPGGREFRESDKVRPGNEIVTVETELGVFGLSICYDLRFPEPFRIMAMRGADVVFIPSSFNIATGMAHFEPLVRARAIENGYYVIAPEQFGTKSSGTVYGNSIAADPWGTVIAHAAPRAEVIYAAIDTDWLRSVREEMPCLAQRRTDVYELIDKTARSK